MYDITAREALEAISRFADDAGACEDSVAAQKFLRQTLQAYLEKGGKEAIREFCVWAQNGCFSLPPDLETPLKIKIDDCPGIVTDKWYEYYDRPCANYCGVDWEVGVQEKPNLAATVFDGPVSGYRLLAASRGPEDPGAHLIVQGLEAGTESEVYSEYTKPDDSSEKIHGERVDFEYPRPRFTRTNFCSVSSITKTATVHHVDLFWYTPATSEKGFLATIDPLVEIPTYRRFQLKSGCGPDGCCHKLTILGRVRIRQHYSPNDILPCTNLRLLMTVAQELQYSLRGDFEKAGGAFRYNEAQLKGHNEYSRQPSQTVNIKRATAGCKLKNFYGGR